MAALGLSVTLTNASLHQAQPAKKASHRSFSATTINQIALSFPISLTVDVSPAAILDLATRSRAMSRIISRLHQQITARHLQGRRAGLVQIFASGPITGIEGSERAAHFVLDRIQRRDAIFAKASGQSFWTGDGDYFVFQIYFFA